MSDDEDDYTTGDVPDDSSGDDDDDVDNGGPNSGGGRAAISVQVSKPASKWRDLAKLVEVVDIMAITGGRPRGTPPIAIKLTGRKGHNSIINQIYGKVDDKECVDGFHSYRSDKSNMYVYWRSNGRIASKGRWYIGSSLQLKHGYFGYLEAYINFSKPHEEHWRIRDHGAWIADDRINIEGTSLHEPTLQKLEKKGQPLPADLTIWHRLFMKFTAITSKSPLFTMFIINVIIVTVSASVLQGYEEQYELDEQKVYDDTWAEFEAEFDMCLNTSAWLNGDMPSSSVTRCNSLKVLKWPAIKNNGWTSSTSGPSLAADWDYSGSLLYMVTISSTVGYGSVTPQTASGKYFTMFISIIAIPAFVVFMAMLGDVLVTAINHLVNSIMQTPKPICEICSGHGRTGDTLADGSEEICHVCEGVGRLAVPDPPGYIVTTFTACFFLLFIAVMGTVYSEVLHGAAGDDGVSPSSWTYGDGLYFATITYTTVGLGDYNFLNGAPGGVIAAFIITLLIGLAAFATFFTSIQDALGTLEKGYHPEHAAAAAEAEAKAMARRESIAANKTSAGDNIVARGMVRMTHV